MVALRFCSFCWPDPAFFFFSSRGRHPSWTGDWSSDVCSSDLTAASPSRPLAAPAQATVIPAAQAYLRSAGAARMARPTRSKSEERRVGKEGRSRWSAEDEKKKTRRRKTVVLVATAGKEGV